MKDRTKTMEAQISQPLVGMMVGISISESPSSELAARGLGKIHLDHAFVELTRHLLSQGATIAYGGDHRVGGFSEILFDLIRTYDRQDKPSVDRILNYLAWPIHESLSAAERAKLVNVAKVISVPLPSDLTQDPVVQEKNPGQGLPGDPAENRRIWARCLSAMRQEMNKAIDARIFLGGRYGGMVGGKLDRFLGKYPGLVEEAHFAIKAGKPVFMLGGFGGCTKVLIETLLGQCPPPLTREFHTQADEVYKAMVEQQSLAPDTPIDYPGIVADFQMAGIPGLRNGLSEEENKRLFETDDTDEMIALVLKGLTLIGRK
jgi:DNA-directed RNA polymerase subunit H (RpoH/RPB5)